MDAGTTLTASSAASEIDEGADAEKENVDPSIQHGGVGDGDGAGVSSTTDGANETIQRKGHGMDVYPFRSGRRRVLTCHVRSR